MKYLPTDENVASMADAILDVDYGETLIGPVALIARAAIDHIQHLTPEPREPALDDRPIYCITESPTGERRWWGSGEPISPFHRHIREATSIEAALMGCIERCPADPPVEWGQWIAISIAGDGIRPTPPPAPEPEWRLREPGVLELVGTPIRLFHQVSLVEVRYHDTLLAAFRSAELNTAKALAVGHLATRRAFGLDGGE